VAVRATQPLENFIFSLDLTETSLKEGDKNKDAAVANEKSQNVQDVFLNHVRKSKTPVTVFLVNGVKLQGVITWFDNFSVLLRRDGHTQLVYKHAISTVMPGAPIMLFDASRAEGSAPAPVETGGKLTLNRLPEPQYDSDQED
jgi:host factor-I protein